MRTHARLALVVSVLLLSAGTLYAQGLDLSGPWSVQIQTLSRGGEGGAVAANCGFQGTANVSQTGSQFTGAIDVIQSSGPGSCPSAMSANLSGSVAGNQVSMGAVMGNASFGQATFTGTITPAARAHPGSSATPAAPVNPGSTITGTFAATSGPFNGTSGTWSATKVAAVAAVPALDARGLTFLALLLLASALWLLWRRSEPRAR